MVNIFNSKLLTIALFTCAFFIALSCSTESEPVYTVTVSQEIPGGGEVTGGTVNQSNKEAKEGETVTLEAVPEEHFVFVRWEGDYTGTENPLTIEVFEDMEIYPIFEKIEYEISINIEGEGSVQEEIIQEKTLDLTQGTKFKLTAVPENGWEFVEWGGDASGEENEIELTVDGEMNVSALFERIDYTVNITIEGEGTVEKEVIQSKASEEFPFETKLQLTATPETGWEFVEWSGDTSGNEDVIEIDINEEKEITASFKKSEFTVSIGEMIGRGTIKQEVIQSKTANNEYTSGTKLRLTAIPESGWEFSNWTGDLSGKSKVEEIIVQDETVIGAKFKKLPSVETVSVSEITKDAAKVRGKVSSRPNVDVLDKGICWSTDPNADPDSNDDYECRSSNPGDGNFERRIGNLSPSSEYFVRAYAAFDINGQDVVLGNQRKFTTESAVELPSVETSPISSMTNHSALSGGTVTNDGGGPVTERGLCWKRNDDKPTLEDNENCVTSGSGTGSFEVKITGLILENNYWVRAYAKNAKGVQYGNEVSFTYRDKDGANDDGGSDDGGSDDGGSDDGGSDDGNISLPTVSTKAISSMTNFSAFSGGTVTRNGGATVTERGVCWQRNADKPTLQNNEACVTSGSGKGSFDVKLTGLILGNNYWVRAYARNAKGVQYGNEVSFTYRDKGGSDDGGSDDGGSDDGGSDDGGSDDGGSDDGGSDDGGTAPPPSGSGTQVLIMNLNAPPIDVKLNGKWYSLKGYSDSKMVGASFTGRIINLPGNLTHLELKPEQIRVDGLNLYGFGQFYHKILLKDSNANLAAPKWFSTKDDINYWASSDGGFIRTAGGFNSTIKCDPKFYIYPVPGGFNSSGKVAIFFSGYGKNHQSFNPFGPNICK